jgi:two-component system sensor histidine kinase DesK
VSLPAAAEGVLALALREAVTNVARHLGCAQLLDRPAHGRRQRPARGARRRQRRIGADGSGLNGMRERAKALGGDVVRDTTSGTCLHVSLPLPQQAAS